MLGRTRHLTLKVNGVPHLLLASDHPIAFAVATLALVCGGLALVGGAFYAHFHSRLSRGPTHGLGFRWIGIVLFALALLMILAALLVH